MIQSIMKSKCFATIQSFWDKKIYGTYFLRTSPYKFSFPGWLFTPLYLATEIGLPWTDIGVIIAVGLFAYVLFEYPIGFIADKWIGEKK